MQIQSEQEALFVAIEMERNAVQTYERALMLTDTQDEETAALRQQIILILQDEQQHLSQFQSLYKGLDKDLEQQLILAAVASSVLFEGGLMSAVRQGMLKDKKSLIVFAGNAEQKAAATYRRFAEICSDKQAADMLLRIANEEDRHLHTLRNYA